MEKDGDGKKGAGGRQQRRDGARALMKYFGRCVISLFTSLAFLNESESTFARRVLSPEMFA
jgi:hypothetical protein